MGEEKVDVPCPHCGKPVPFPAIASADGARVRLTELAHSENEMAAVQAMDKLCRVSGLYDTANLNLKALSPRELQKLVRDNIGFLVPYLKVPA